MKKPALLLLQPQEGQNGSREQEHPQCSFFSSNPGVSVLLKPTGFLHFVFILSFNRMVLDFDLRGLKISQWTRTLLSCRMSLLPGLDQSDTLLILGGPHINLVPHLEPLHCFHMKHRTTTSCRLNLMFAATFNAHDSPHFSPLCTPLSSISPNPLLFDGLLPLSPATAASQNTKAGNPFVHFTPKMTLLALIGIKANETMF